MEQLPEVFVNSMPDSDAFKTCALCFKQPAVLEFMPCHHTMMCVSCYRQRINSFYYCPYCGSKVVASRNLKHVT